MMLSSLEHDQRKMDIPCVNPPDPQGSHRPDMRPPHVGGPPRSPAAMLISTQSGGAHAGWRRRCIWAMLAVIGWRQRLQGNPGKAARRRCKTEARWRGASGRRLQQKQQEEAAVIANNALPVGAAGPRPCMNSDLCPSVTAPCHLDLQQSK